MQERPVIPQYNPQRLLHRPPTQQLAVQLALPRAKRLPGLLTATPVDRPLAIKEPASRMAKRIILQGTAQQR